MQPQPAYRTSVEPELTTAMQALINPGKGYVGCREVLEILAQVKTRLGELGSLPLGDLGHRLVALRYFIANGETWLRFFAWQPPLEKIDPSAPERVRKLAERVAAAKAAQLASSTASLPLAELARTLEQDAGFGEGALQLLCAIQRDPSLPASLLARLRDEAPQLHAEAPRVADLIYLASYDLTRFPATTVGAAALQYVIVADKGEMGVRAVREALALGKTPVVLHSATDDANALQVRLAQAGGGFAIPLAGNFRESYANPVQMARRVREVYEERFEERAEAELARSAIYPGYGPLAESTAAIEHFRKSGIVFVGPMQDVVERAGDKRKFRLLAQSIDPEAVVPGIVIDDDDAEQIVAAIEAGHASGKFQFPGRLKAANGGGGRGQVVVPAAEGVRAAVSKVLGEITANGWDRGVMFEQNIFETIHLEVQVLRDRYGNVRHFGMRDCSEQRASQKIQEEAPPALLRAFPGLTERICAVATQIADAVGYCGACTVELMFKNGHFYLLEMNTRIQVEHPVTEEAHRIRTAEGLMPLDLVALQLQIANGAPIPFAQEDVVMTHVAREFRINAESWRGDVKDSRDGKLGLFVPNAGAFEKLVVPSAEEVLHELTQRGVTGIDDLTVRFDCGFEAKDKLVNKDPTFGKLIVAVQTKDEPEAYELLRLASLEVLARTRIEGQALRPDGGPIKGAKFLTNLPEHTRVLEAPLLREHSHRPAEGRHVNWVAGFLRG
ncbi:MAG TPA: biotin carboxylase N-terminal domain-containing protein [Polyangiales bacterium]|nr:biotin carboxylase N-terminal domain-containing protein [Polyangiales bacterium]